MSDAGSGRGPKAVAKRAIAPFERRFEIATAKALEDVVRRELHELQAAIQADLATIVELGYELQRRIERLEALEQRLGTHEPPPEATA
jgi:hypothetical protein